MPIEIRELIIKAAVVQDSNNAPAGAGTTSGNNESAGEELIKTCVDKVLEILKEKHER